jgi:hypothetical protein
LRVSLAMMTLMSGILDPPAHGMIISLLIWLAPHKDGANFGSVAPAAQRSERNSSSVPVVRWGESLN